jgi:hypothetical protein
VYSPEVIIEAYEDAICDLSPVQQNLVTAPVQPFASIRDISAQFSLNTAQHVAFTLIAVPLLAKITGQTLPPRRAAMFNNAPIVVTGAGGTGKSRVISAVRALCNSWHHSNAVKVVASTGIAAASLNGCTMHSSVGLGINCTRLPKHVDTPTDTLIRQWAPVQAVIADEVSMVDLAFFGLWEEALRHVKDDREQPFGGLITVLMFDHCQLRTVKRLPMYKSSNGRTPLTPHQERGCRLYRDITKVIYLKENMRFVEDPVWGQWLSSARLGGWPEELRCFIDNIPDFGRGSSFHNGGLIQTISTDNATRVSINDTAVPIAVRLFGHERRVFVIPSRVSRRASTTELATIRSLPDNKTGNIPPFLHAYIGTFVLVHICAAPRTNLFIRRHAGRDKSKPVCGQRCR